MQFAHQRHCLGELFESMVAIFKMRTSRFYPLAYDGRIKFYIFFAAKGMLLKVKHSSYWPEIGDKNAWCLAKLRSLEYIFGWSLLRGVVCFWC